MHILLIVAVILCVPLVSSCDQNTVGMHGHTSEQEESSKTIPVEMIPAEPEPLGVPLHPSGTKGKGLDRNIDMSSVENFVEGCAKMYSEMKDINPNEFAALKAADYAIVDLSTMEGELAFRSVAGHLCQSFLGHAVASNGKFKRFRDLMVANIEMDIDELKKSISNASVPIQNDPVLESIYGKLISKERAYLVLTGKSYGVGH